MLIGTLHTVGTQLVEHKAKLTCGAGAMGVLIHSPRACVHRRFLVFSASNSG